MRDVRRSLDQHVPKCSRCLQKSCPTWVNRGTRDKCCRFVATAVLHFDRLDAVNELKCPAPEEPPPSTISPQALRLTPLRPSSIPPPSDLQVVRPVADLLLGAAHSDGRVSERELRAVRKLTCQLTGDEESPLWLEARISTFSLQGFDLDKTAAELSELPVEQRRHVLEVARRVCDSDNAYDIEEERFMLTLVLALGMAEEDVSDIVLETSANHNAMAKRVFDIAFSLTFLLFAFPMLIAIGLAVRLTSKGDALFKQKRFGLNGKQIVVWKFRTMTVTEDGDSVKQAVKHDARVTKLGAFLRRTSMDELPQFVNVLLGDMSVVGPRPHAVAHNTFYRTQILEYMLRHKVKPGITGLAQVNGWRGETDTLDKMVGRVHYDLMYIREQSLWLDIKIIFDTVFGNSSSKNAY